MTIAQVSGKYDISPYTLRYYEKAGLIPCVRRRQGGVRDYTDADCDWIGFIKCMRGAGLPVDVLAEYVGLFQQGDSTIEARKKILLEQRVRLIGRIKDMQQTLSRLDYKIEQYEKMVIPKERKLNNREG